MIYVLYTGWTFLDYLGNLTAGAFSDKKSHYNTDFKMRRKKSISVKFHDFLQYSGYFIQFTLLQCTRMGENEWVDQMKNHSHLKKRSSNLVYLYMCAKFYGDDFWNRHFFYRKVLFLKIEYLDDPFFDCCLLDQDF